MQKIRIDFDNPGLPQHISAVENDSQSRFFEAALYENGKAYTAPEGATYSIMYRGFGPQNQGWYDTINDGAGKRAACAVSGNVVTCEIARQALQVPGHVSIVLCVTTGNGYMLKSWPIECDCKNDRYDSTVEIQSFFYVTQVSNESWTQAIQAVEELKNTIDPTLSVSGKAADAAKVGEAVGQLKEDIGDVESVTFTVKKGSTNVFDYTNITSGKILKQDIGISTSETYQDSAKGFVANQTWNVKKGDVIYTTSAYCGLCVYDANGVLQEHFNNSNKNNTITVDSAHFLRLYSSASNATYTTDFMLSIDEPLPSTYEAYKPDKKISNFIKLEEKTNENGQNIKDLSKYINAIELSQNLLDNSSVIENKRPSNWAGQTINDSYKTDGYYTFKAIPVTQNSTYYFVENGDLVNFGQLATYDKDGKYVSMLTMSTLNVNGVNVGYIIPENIAYVRGESKTSNFSNVNFKLFNGRFEKKFLKYNESEYDLGKLPVVVFDFDQVVEIDARFTILKKYGFVGNVVEVATNSYEITKKLIRMGYDISPYLGNHTWDYSTEDGIQKLTANIAEKLGGLEAIGVYNPTMISCSGHKYSDTMEKILSSYKIDYVRCSAFIKDGVSLKKSIYENSYGTRIVVPIGLGSYNGADEFNAIIDSLVDGNVPLIMPFMHTFGYDADWITQEAFEKVVSHVSDLVKNGKALCMNMHDFVAYNDTVKSIHDDYVRNMSAIFN